MTNKRLNLPVGISTLANIIEGNYTYVDKTHHIANLVNSGGKYYFLSRPRRFGKSSFLDTLKQAFLGRKELFTGLYLEHNWDWSKKYPVIHFDFGEGSLRTQADLQAKIHKFLDEFYIKYDIIDKYPEISSRFSYLIQQIALKTNSKVVVLVDEYDKPILDNILDVSTAILAREELKSLYSVIKSNDEYLRFVFLTGVTKFSKVSLFSGLNNLRDLTLNADYADICGYTQAELEREFDQYLIGIDKTQLKTWYNGYNFGDHEDKKVYNPFDILLFFAEGGKLYKNYWFETGSPSFLLKLINQEKYYLPELENYYASEELLSSFDVDKIQFETLLFQTGYLTIKEVIVNPASDSVEYTLTYPNKEVRSSLSRSLLNDIVPRNSHTSRIIPSLTDILVKREFDRLHEVLYSYFAGFPYNWYTNNNIVEYEGFYATVVYCMFNSIGIPAIPEDATNTGRIDMTIHLPEYKIILEFKMSDLGDAESALQQIKDKNYALKYQLENKPIYLIGISFNAEKRNLDGIVWEACE